MGINYEDHDRIMKITIGFVTVDFISLFSVFDSRQRDCLDRKLIDVAGAHGGAD
jgi:hypothetical protein